MGTGKRGQVISSVTLTETKGQEHLELTNRILKAVAIHVQQGRLQGPIFHVRRRISSVASD
jgi:hypothetical protein